MLESDLFKDQKKLDCDQGNVNRQVRREPPIVEKGHRARPRFAPIVGDDAHILEDVSKCSYQLKMLAD
jgi:hypothetical protein